MYECSQPAEWRVPGTDKHGGGGLSVRRAVSSDGGGASLGGGSDRVR